MNATGCVQESPIGSLRKLGSRRQTPARKSVNKDDKISGSEFDKVPSLNAGMVMMGINCKKDATASGQENAVRSKLLKK
jgi:hypothetical protein